MDVVLGVAKALASSILGMCLPWSQNFSIRFHRIGNTPATSNSILSLKDLLPAEILKIYILLGFSSSRLTYKHTAYYFYLKVLQKRCRPPTDLPAHPSTSCWFEVRTSYSWHGQIAVSTKKRELNGGWISKTPQYKYIITNQKRFFAGMNGVFGHEKVSTSF